MKLSFLAVALFAISALPLKAAEADPFFPFPPGRYWIYAGRIAFQQGEKTFEREIKDWRCEIVEAAAGKKFRAALMKGHPHDLAWYEDGKQPSLRILVMTDAGAFHEVIEGDTAAEFATLKKTGALPKGMLTVDTLIFKRDMKPDDRFGDPEATKNGPRYCWVVEGVKKGAALPGIKGLLPQSMFTTYDLAYLTSPDDTHMQFTPMVGFVSYAYHHHGTRGDCDLKLVETGDNSTPARSPKE
jgi:hypothetical protein